MDQKKLKPFELDAAMRGEPLVTRDGRSAHFIAFVQEFDPAERVVVRIKGLGCAVSVAIDGSFKPNAQSCYDLFMAPRKRTVFVNLYPKDDPDCSINAAWHETSQEAYAAAEPFADVALAVAVPIEIEV